VRLAIKFTHAGWQALLFLEDFSSGSKDQDLMHFSASASMQTAEEAVMPSAVPGREPVCAWAVGEQRYLLGNKSGGVLDEPARLQNSSSLSGHEQPGICC